MLDQVLDRFGVTDLTDAERDVGLRTAFVARPLEWGPVARSEQLEPGEFDVVARDLGHLADQLLAPTPAIA